MFQVASYEEVLQLRQQLSEVTQRLARLENAQPEWVRESEAAQLTGLSQRTLARERAKPNTLLVFKTAGGVRYLRSSVEAYNKARTIRRHERVATTD